MTQPPFSPWVSPPGLGHPIFSPSHLAGKTPPPLYLATDGRRPDLPPGLVGARGGLGTSVREEGIGGGWRRKRRKEEGRRQVVTLSPGSVFLPRCPRRGACTAVCRAPAPPRAPLWVALPSCPQAPQVRPPHLTCLPLGVQAWEGRGTDRSPAQPTSSGRLQPRRRRSASVAALALANNEGRSGSRPASVSWAPPGGQE